MTSPQKTTLAFLIFGLAWIYLTDKFFLLISGPDLVFYSKIQTYKGFLFVGLSAALIYFVSSFFSKKINRANKNLTISNQKLSVLLDERLRNQKRIAEAIIKAQEAERKQLGEELHDNINQILATTKLYLDIARDHPHMQEDLMQKSSVNISEVISELRKLSKTLSPPSLGDIGLIASIEDLLNGILHAGSLEANFYHDYFSEEKLTADKQLVLYRIIQEQMNNVMRHSDAKIVVIELKNNEHYLDLNIQDDGIGFDPAKPSSGIGLKNIRNRALLYNGTMNIDSSPGEGCLLHVKMEL